MSFYVSFLLCTAYYYFYLFIAFCLAILSCISIFTWFSLPLPLFMFVIISSCKYLCSHFYLAGIFRALFFFSAKSSEFNKFDHFAQIHKCLPNANNSKQWLLRIPFQFQYWGFRFYLRLIESYPLVKWETARKLCVTPKKHTHTHHSRYRTCWM